jgi:light-regulated signal transduction histidine kinase (bacteriophytochrome)
LSKGTGFLAFIRDVTEQKNNVLQLELKTRELERMNLQLEEFAFIASHDLKEPLRKISLYSSILVTSELDNLSDKGKANINKISEASARMQSLIDGILSYSSCNDQADKAMLSLEDLYQIAVDNLEYKIQETGAYVTSDGLPRAYVIGFQIQQLFQNLIGNALKFSKKEKPPIVRISHSKMSGIEVQNKGLNPAKTFVEIKISDNGIGFSNDVAQKIFGLYQRLHSKKDYEGSGLGLAICRKIVENHGGLISATSQPGVGSTFYIVLPARG